MVKSLIEKSEKRMPLGKRTKANECIFARLVEKKVNGWLWLLEITLKPSIWREGVSLACSQCEKTFRFKHTLRLHKRLNHKVLQAEYFSI